MNEILTKIQKEALNKAFKAYDVRGRIPDELNDTTVRMIGNAFIQFLKNVSKPIIVGYDVRPTSEQFSKALIDGITDAGVDVINIGLVGTDMVYFATAYLKSSGGIMITASHNPANYNGLKFVREDAIAISSDTGLIDIKNTVLSGKYLTAEKKGKVEGKNIVQDYVKHVLSFINPKTINPMKIVMNAGNGCAGIVLPELTKKIPQITTIPVFWEPDGSFPNGIPNPLLLEKREETSQKVKAHQADLGVAWDGDFDRCFFYDNDGSFVEGYYLVALFGEFFAKKNPGVKIIHDPRLIWATQEVVLRNGGIPVMCKAGHAFIKERMRKEDAIYAGEMSAHHYFKDNFYADNGMIPLVLLLQILSEKKISLKELVRGWISQYPVSGEINIEVINSDLIISNIEKEYKPKALKSDYTDGLSLEFDNWRFNLRKSNTEPVIRLNVETKNDYSLMESKRDEILSKIKNHSQL
ncbi:MAG: phosphomannomutase/phosphoglucomutase [Candidatus Thorarchaeota archaeon]